MAAVLVRKAMIYYMPMIYVGEKSRHTSRHRWPGDGVICRGFRGNK